MINSRKLADLHPFVANLCQQFKDGVEESLGNEGVEILITSTLRDNESQAALYAQGRTKPGKIVTNARAGQSFHNYGVAFDIVPVRNGKLVWGNQGDDGVLWAQIGAIGESVGLEWAANWSGFPELAHFQYTGGLSIQDLKAGKTLDDVL